MKPSIAPLLAAAFSAILAAAALADPALNDAYVKAGSRVALRCDRLSMAQDPHKPNQLHAFVDCMLNTEFSDATTPEEELQQTMKQVAMYYIAVFKYGGDARRHDYGTVGASGMRWLTLFGPAALIHLNANGYPPERLCQIFSWIDCAKLKSLPGAGL
jgi:hypothetical protein